MLAAEDMLFAAAVGAIAQLIVRGKLGIVVAFACGIGVFALSIIYQAYFGSYVGGGASMWPLAVILSGPVFGSVSAVAAVTVGIFRGDLRASKRHGP